MSLSATKEATMTRRIRGGLFALTLLCALALPFGVTPALAQTSAPFRLQLVKSDDPNVPVTDTAFCRVMTAGAQTEPTIYTTGTLATAATNPLTVNTTTGQVEFFMDGATTTVDAICWADTGTHAGTRKRVDAVSRAGAKRVVLDNSSPMKTAIFVNSITAGGVAAVSSTATLPVGALIKDALVETVTAVASSTLYVGRSPAASNICADVATSAVGFVNCAPTTLLNTAVLGVLAFSDGGHASKTYTYVHYYETGNRSD